MTVTDITTKICTKCGKAKPGTEFHKHARERDGLKCWCKACTKLDAAVRYAANPEKSKAVLVKWRAANPGRAKAAAAAYRAANPEKAKARNVKYYAANHEKVKANAVKWQTANSEKHRAASAKWSTANPEACRIRNQNRRARKREAGGKLSKGLAERLFKLQRGKCACGCKQSLGNDYHLDHRMPLALGGSNTDDNMQLLTALCNMQKHAKHPIDFMQQRGFLL